MYVLIGRGTACFCRTTPTHGLS